MIPLTEYEKVVLGLQCCDDLGSPDCERCPYMDDDFVGTCKSRNPLLKDALKAIRALDCAVLREYGRGLNAGIVLGQSGCKDDD